jgi:putative peptide zinc metalloprotease protein
MTPPHGAHGVPATVSPPSPDALPIPTRAAGVELVGEMRGTGYRTPPKLVRRADGQALHLTPLLYEVLAATDGRRTYHEVAAVVSARTARVLTAADAAFLLETKLRPLGVLRRPDGDDPEVVKANPLLALRLKYVVTDPARTARLTAPFAALFRPAIVLAVLAVFAASVWWIMFDKGLGGATHEAFHDPRLLLLVVGLTVLSAGFHEFGHAAACRYGGATPGAMGAGLYLVWPAFYTDVTDSYRLGRWGRLRVDVGGLYFNAVFAVGIMGAWWLTRWDALLLVVATQVLQMARQLTPLVRFDGYHILADLTGVPDLFLHLKPTLLAMWPGNWGRPENKVLKPWARAVVVTWVLLVVPVLAALLVALIAVFPRLVATAWSGLGTQVEVLGRNWADGDLASVGVRIVSMLSLAIPALSVTYLLTRIARRTVRRVWAAAGEDARRRLAVVLAGLLGLSALAWAWWPGERYVPVEAADRGVVQELFPVRALPPETPDEDGEPLAAAATDATTTAPAPQPTPSPTTAPATRAASGPAATTSTNPMLPTATSTVDTGPATTAAAPADRGPWPFPWARPTAGDGDNLALAAVTRDRRAVHDVALSEIWVHDGAEVANVNAAHAYAACVDCSAVAAAYQLVLIVGTDTEVVVPENHAVAATYECERCVAHAVAVQTVATLTEVPDPRTRAELTRLLRSLESLRGEIRQLTILDVHARMKAVEAQVLLLLDREGYLAWGVSEQDTAHDEDAASAELGPDAPALGEEVPDGDGADAEHDGTSADPEDRPSTTVTDGGADAEDRMDGETTDRSSGDGTSDDARADHAGTDPEATPDGHADEGAATDDDPEADTGATAATEPETVGDTDDRVDGNDGGDGGDGDGLDRDRDA